MKVADQLRGHFERWGACVACHLHRDRTQVVFARGHVPADIGFIGEAPGESEDAVGRPFVGPAGRLLDQIVERAGLNGVKVPDGAFAGPEDYRRLRLCFFNLICCIPRDEDGAKVHEPESGCVKACRPRLIEFVRIVKPRLIVTVGKLASRHVCGQAMFALPEEDGHPSWIPEGQFMEFVEIVHPAAILRANEMQQEMMFRRAVIVLRNKVREVFE